MQLNKIYLNMFREINYPYLLFSHSCSYIFCWGKKPFYPPSPVQSRHLYRWLIDWIFNRIFFVSFCLQVHWCISAFFCVLYKCRPLCISYFLKKAEDNVFWPTGRAGFGKKIFTPIEIFVLQVTGPLGLSDGTGFCCVGFHQRIIF